MERSLISEDFIPVSILEDLDDALVILDSSGLISYANHSAKQLLDIDSLDTTRPSVHQLKDRNLQMFLESLLLLLTPENVKQEGEFLEERNGSNARWFRWKLRAVFNSLHELMQVQIIGRDISDHKHCESPLSTSQKFQEDPQKQKRQLQRENLSSPEQAGYYRDLFNNAHEILFVYDLNGRLLNVNQAFVDLFGVDCSDSSDYIIDRLLPPDFLDFPSGGTGVAMTGEQTMIYEIEATACDGRVLPLEISSRLLSDGNGQPYAVYNFARDISRRKANEKALRESRQYLANLINFLPDATMVIDENHQVIAWNQAMEDLTGLPAEYMLGLGDYAYSLPFLGEKRPILIDLVLDPSLKNETDYENLVWANNHLWADSFCPALGPSGKYISATSSPLYDSQGRIVGAVESIRDITERRRIEKELQESEAKFRSLVETIPGVYILQGKKFRFVNDGLINLLGYTAQEIYALDFMDLIHPEHREMLARNAAARQLGGEVPNRYQFKAVGKNGQVFWLDLSAEFITYEGQPAIIATVNDITASRETEQALKESEAKLKLITDNAPGMIFIWQDNSIRYANSNLCATLDYSEQEILRHDFLDIIHPDDYEAMLALATQCTGNRTVRFETRLINSTGQEIWIDLTAAMIEYEGNPALIAMANDISDMIRLREAWRKTETTFQQLTGTVPACISIIQDYRYRYVNNYFTRLLGYGMEDLKDMNSLLLIHPEYRNFVRQGLKDLHKDKDRIFREDIMVLPRDGQVRWLDFSASLFEWEGRPAIISAAYDITRRRELQSALVQSENNFRQLSDAAPTLIFVLTEGKLLYVNQAFVDASGYSREECLEMEPWSPIHPQYREWVKKTAQARLRGEQVPNRYQTCLRSKAGQDIWVDFNLARIDFNGIPATLCIAIDISEQKKAQEQIEYLSYYDKITGLHNRAYLEEKASQLDDYDSLPLSMIIGDVNGLKMVNDAFGHQTGDLMLQRVARILYSHCSKKDVVARWGGDEFVILLPNCEKDRARRICNRIYQSCSQIKDFPLQVSIALGVATRKSLSEGLLELFKEAEDRMYRNKLLENRSTRSSFLNSLEKTLWVRSHETQEHTVRLRHMVLAIGQHLALPPDELNSLTLLATLHDIGKIAIPNTILDKPDRLTPDEWELMKKHPEIGYRIALSTPELATIAEAILTHHERWDGSGYPLGVKGFDIPLISRILALADAYDVMISGRPYQKGISPEAAQKEIIDCAGTQFDPKLAQIFIELLQAPDSLKVQEA